MKAMYCWRCGRVVPMLDEQEFAVVEPLYFEAVYAIKTHRLQSQENSAQLILDQYRPALEAYRLITGVKHATHPSAHSTPPEITEAETPKTPATSPDSVFPRAGPLV